MFEEDVAALALFVADIIQVYIRDLVWIECGTVYNSLELKLIAL